MKSYLFLPCVILMSLCLAAPVALSADPVGPSEALLKMKEEAVALHDTMVKTYMTGDWIALEEARKTYKKEPKHKRHLDREQLDRMKYIDDVVDDLRPRWWPATRNSSAIKFPATLWNKKFVANYDPSMDLGVQRVRGTYRIYGSGKMKLINVEVTVSWKPNLIDNPKPAEGKLAEIQGLTLGNLAEVIVWHELGHNYITSSIPLQYLLELYENHSLLYQHLQEYFADIAALCHTTPASQRATMMIRLWELDYYDEVEPHTRGGFGIGSQFLAHVMSNPDKWPSIHLPPEVPKQQVELNTIIYMYEHWDPNWSFDEAKQLREFFQEFIKRNGDKVFGAKGQITLENGLKFNLMVADDREHQVERDKWVADKLRELIAAGRADKMDESYVEPPIRKKRAHFVRIKGDKEIDESLKIELPW